MEIITRRFNSQSDSSSSSYEHAYNIAVHLAEAIASLPFFDHATVQESPDEKAIAIWATTEEKKVPPPGLPAAYYPAAYYVIEVRPEDCAAVFRYNIAGRAGNLTTAPFPLSRSSVQEATLCILLNLARFDTKGFGAYLARAQRPAWVPELVVPKVSAPRLEA